MRISDWSSDVCSSDLATTMTARHGRLSSAPQGETSTLFLVDGVRLESAPAEDGRPASRSSASRSPASRAGVLTFDQSEIPIDLDRKRVVEGKSVYVSVDLGGGRYLTKKKNRTE